MRICTLFLSCFVLTLHTASVLYAADGSALVSDSKAVGVIVTSTNATDREKRAADALREYIEKCTGAQLPIVQEGRQDASAVAIHIGGTALGRTVVPESLDPDGFLLSKVSDRAFVIVGGSDWGTEFGVYEFLERYLGVRWLAPTDLFTVTPKRSELTLPDVDETVVPAFLSREFFPIVPDRKGDDPMYGVFQSPSMAPYLLGDTWGRFNKLRARVEFHHKLLEILPPSKYGKTNPEFYPVIRGEHFVPPTDDAFMWQPNFSAPGIAEATAAEISHFFDENPDAISYSLGMNDSLQFDESAASKARRSGKLNRLGIEDISDDYYLWVNDVVELVDKTHPGKSFGLLAYYQVIEPPTKFEVNPSVVPYITYELTRWMNPDAREIVQDLTLSWEKAVPSIGWYDYVWGHGYLVPRSFPRALHDALQWGQQHRVHHYYAEAVPNWGEGPSLWVITRLLWNPNQDIDDVLDEWYTAAAGPAAAPKLKAFYEVWERFWERDILSSRWYSIQTLWTSYTDPLYLDSVPMEYVERADALMKEAIELAETPEQRARVEKLNEMWQVSRASVIAWHGEKLWNDAHIRTEAEALAWLERCREIIQISRDRQVNLSRLNEDPLFAHSAYRILTGLKQGDTWGTAPLWALVPWARKSEAVRNQLEQLAQEDGNLPAPYDGYYEPNGVRTKMSHKGPLVAQRVLAAADGQATQLLQNGSFEEGTAGWSLTNAEVSGQNSLDGRHSLAVKTSDSTVVRQAIPYEPGAYFTEVSFFTPKGINPGKGRVTVEVRITSPTGDQMGEVPPLAVLTPRPGEWVTSILAVEGPAFPYPTKDHSIIIRTEGFSSEQVLYFDNIGFFKADAEGKAYHGTGPDGR